MCSSNRAGRNTVSINTTPTAVARAAAAAVLRAGDPNQTVEGRVVLAARVDGEAFEVIDPPATALRPGDALSLVNKAAGPVSSTRT